MPTSASRCTTASPSRADADVRDYRFLEEEPFETEYGVTGMVRQRQREYLGESRRNVSGGVSGDSRAGDEGGRSPSEDQAL